MFDELFNPKDVEIHLITRTCRECEHRQRWKNHFSPRVTQHCALQKVRRNSVGLKKIKVTDKACIMFEERE